MIPNIDMRYIIQGLKRIRYLREKEAVKLANANYLTIYDVAKSDSKVMSDNTGINTKRAEIIIQSADAYLKPFGIWKTKLKIPKMENLIFIDVEYNRHIDKIWMISLIHLEEAAQFFVSHSTNDLLLLEQIFTYLNRYQNTSLICYSQSNYDFRILSTKAKQHNFTELIHLLENRRKIDLGLELNKVFDPPKGSLKLKDLVKLYNIDLPYKHLSNRKISDEYIAQINKFGTLSRSFLEMIFENNVTKAKLLPRLLDSIEHNIEWE